MKPELRICTGDALHWLKQMASDCINCTITSPPYFGLRNYGADGQIGLEKTFDEYLGKLVEVFREVRRVLRPDGTLWLNVGDSYANGAEQGCKPKDLLGIPWRLAFALQADGWYLRQDIIWSKPNPMPESVRDRCTKAHEYLFLLSKSEKYWFDADAIKEEATNRPPGNKTHKGKTAYEAGDEKMRTKVGFTEIGARETRNKRSVWSIAPEPFREAHFATFPTKLVEPCMLAGSPVGGVVLDPFGGSGTVGVVAKKLGRHCILVELNPTYAEMAQKRVDGTLGA